MDISRRNLLRAAGTSVVGGAVLGAGAGTAGAHADVADEFRPAHESNYEDAWRSSADIDWLVLHTIEGSYEAGIGWFQDPDSDVSSHFVVGEEPGEIAQVVHCEDVAWANGHGGYNDRGIALDLEGWADETAFDDHVYRQAAQVARWVCEEYDIPVRHPTFDLGPCAGRGEGGIVGHDQIPSPDDCSTVVGDRYDPGDTWDWERFLALVRSAPCTGDAVTTREEGSLSGAGDGDEYSHEIRTGDTCRTRVSLSGPDDADFDLFVTLDGRTPSRTDYDRAARSTDSSESVVLGDRAVDPGGTLGVYVDAYRGSGAYDLTVTETGERRFEEGKWVRTTADCWGYQYPRESARRLERLSTGTHGRIVNGPVQQDGRTWWGMYFQNERVWAWVAVGRLTPAPGGPQFTLGDEVHTTLPTFVHGDPSTDAPVVGFKYPSSRGEIVDSAARADGYVWWRVRFADDTAAWCPQERLSE